MTREPYLHPLCEALRDERRRRKLSQKAVARMAGTWQSSLSEWESGRAVPGLENLDNWAAALNFVITIHAKEN